MSNLADGTPVIEHRGCKLRVLTLADLAGIATTWQERLRRAMLPVMDELGLSPGQKLIAMRDFAMDPPGLQAVSRYCVTPEGIDAALKAAGADKPDLLGTPFERYELVGRLLQLEPAGGVDVADPTMAGQQTAAERPTTSGDTVTPSSPTGAPG